MSTPPRLSIAKLMVIVAILACDLAALSVTRPAIPNPGLVLMVAILQVGLFFAAARRGRPAPSGSDSRRSAGSMSWRASRPIVQPGARPFAL